MSSDTIPYMLIGGGADGVRGHLPHSEELPAEQRVVVKPVAVKALQATVTTRGVIETNEPGALAYAVYALRFVHRDAAGQARGVVYEYAGREAPR